MTCMGVPKNYRETCVGLGKTLKGVLSLSELPKPVRVKNRPRSATWAQCS